MAIQKGVCESCMQTISNPICTKCYLKYFDHWLRDLKLENEQRKNILGRIKKEISKETLNNDMCVICKKETTSICTYCSFFKMYRVINQLAKRYSEDFETVFNYQIEELGV